MMQLIVTCWRIIFQKIKDIIESEYEDPEELKAILKDIFNSIDAESKLESLEKDEE